MSSVKPSDLVFDVCGRRAEKFPWRISDAHNRILSSGSFMDSSTPSIAQWSVTVPSTLKRSVDCDPFSIRSSGFCNKPRLIFTRQRGQPFLRPPSKTATHRRLRPVAQIADHSG